MTRIRWRTAVAAASVFMLGQLVLAVPVGAVTGPATVTADQHSAVPAGRLWSFNDFFPRTVTVQTGTDLQFINQGFHTFTVLPAGTTAKQDEHANGLAVDDTDDTGLNPNGTTHSELNQPALLPTSLTCGSSADPCAFDGHSVVSSGAPAAPPAAPPAPFVVHVSADPGTYVFVCRIHAGMTGKLRVVAVDAQVPSQAQVDKQVAKQVKHDLAGAWAADRQAEHDVAKLNLAAAWKAKHDAVKHDGDGAWVADRKAEHDAAKHDRDRSRTLYVTAGTSSRDGKVALLEFFPRNLNAKPGDKVVFTPKSPNEPHTVTFPGDLGTEFVPFCENGTTDVLGLTGCNSGPPDELELDGGNGVWHVTQPGPGGTVSDSGIIGSPRLAKAFGAAKTDILNKWTISLAGAAPGTYTYVCQIHDGMEATITVH